MFATFDDGEALVEAVRAGLGVTQVPSYMAEDGLRSGELIEILGEIRSRPSPINALYVSQRNLPARIRTFVDWLSTLSGPQYPLPIVPAESSASPPPARRRVDTRHKAR